MSSFTYFASQTNLAVIKNITWQYLLRPRPQQRFTTTLWSSSRWEWSFDLSIASEKHFFAFDPNGGCGRLSRFFYLNKRKFLPPFHQIFSFQFLEKEEQFFERKCPLYGNKKSVCAMTCASRQICSTLTIKIGDLPISAQCPVIWCAVQIKWLLAIWNATLGWKGLIRKCS